MNEMLDKDPVTVELETFFKEETARLRKEYVAKRNSVSAEYNIDQLVLDFSYTWDCDAKRQEMTDLNRRYRDTVNKLRYDYEVAVAELERACLRKANPKKRKDIIQA